MDLKDRLRDFQLYQTTCTDIDSIVARSSQLTCTKYRTRLAVEEIEVEEKTSKKLKKIRDI